jgi:hypothetical protein
MMESAPALTERVKVFRDDYVVHRAARSRVRTAGSGGVTTTAS